MRHGTLWSTAAHARHLHLHLRSQPAAPQGHPPQVTWRAQLSAGGGGSCGHGPFGSGGGTLTPLPALHAAANACSWFTFKNGADSPLTAEQRDAVRVVFVASLSEHDKAPDFAQEAVSAQPKSHAPGPPHTAAALRGSCEVCRWGWMPAPGRPTTLLAVQAKEGDIVFVDAPEGYGQLWRKVCVCWGGWSTCASLARHCDSAPPALPLAGLGVPQGAGAHQPAPSLA